MTEVITEPSPHPESPHQIEVTAPKSPGFWKEAWRRFRQRKLGMVALAFVDPPQIDFDDLYQRAEEIHALLGLDDGKDWVDGLYAWMDQD